MSQLVAFFAQRAMSNNERFIVMPLFMLMALVMIGFGIAGVANKRIGGSARDRRRGKTEFTGGQAVAKGVVLIIAGIALIIIALVMMIRGKTLLPG